MVRLRTIVIVATILFASLIVSTLTVGRPFLVQFFINPFQMFIVIPWGISCYCRWRGFMPLKSGGRIERATDPVQFWMLVRWYEIVGVVFFLVNLALAWLVLSRRH